MKTYLEIGLIITSIALILSVILQSKGAGLGWLTVARDSKQPLEYSFSSDSIGNGKYAYFLVKAVI